MKKTDTTSGKSERAKERQAKACASRAKGRNSKREAYHGKGGALSPGGFVLSPLHSNDIATADPIVAPELTKSQVESIFNDFSNVFELLDISLGLIQSQDRTKRGEWLTTTLQNTCIDFLDDSSLKIGKIDSNADLIRELTGIKAKLIAEGFIEEVEALTKHSTRAHGS